VRVGERCRNRDLADEALGAEVGGELGTKDLEGHLAVVLQVQGKIDGGHPPGAQHPLETVVVGQGRLQAIRRIGHPDFEEIASPRYAVGSSTIRSPITALAQLN